MFQDEDDSIILPVDDSFYLPCQANQVMGCRCLRRLPYNDGMDLCYLR